MSTPTVTLDKTLLEQALRWFQPIFRERLVGPIESHFPGHPLPGLIQTVLADTADIVRVLGTWGGDACPPTVGELVVRDLSLTSRPLFKQIVLLYRRHRAADTESKVEKTINLGNRSRPGGFPLTGVASGGHRRA